MLTPNDTAIASSVTDIAAMAGLKELWAETLGDPRICIAILDGPVDKSHPSLSVANLCQLETLVSAVADRGPASQHGTHVASVIFGHHDGQVKGIAPSCRGLIVPVFEDGANGSIALCSQLDLARAITQAAEEGAHIINISGGEFSPSGSAYPILADAVRNCAERGVLIVAATGNEGCNCLHIPGALPSVLVVGAMNSRGEPMDFSNWGDKYQTQGILSPGENILGANPGGGTVTNSGTSYATPIVSGVAALLLSVQVKHGLKPDPQSVRAAILSTTVGCDDQTVPDCRRLLAGRFNIEGATYQITRGEGGVKIMSDSMKIQENAGAYVTGGLRQSPTASTVASQENKKSVSQGLVNPSQETPSGCSCGCSNPSECSCECGKPQLVFAIGTLGFDFGTEARRDSIMQHMKPDANNPYDPNQLLTYLKDNPSGAAAIIWTLSLDATPIYAIQPQGAFASNVYQKLREFLCEQQTGRKFDLETGECKESNDNQTAGKVERVSIPGYISGKVRLFTGHVVPVIQQPELRGMYSWNTEDLIKKVLESISPPPEDEEGIKKAIREFLQRVYYDFRNLGIRPQDRAINYSATNILPAGEAIKNAIEEQLRLDTIEVVRSPVCRPDSDCWDVKLLFFDPENDNRPRKVYLFTIDVSDVVPVNLAPVRSWFVR